MGSWVYFLREPIQHMFDFSASDEQGRSLNWKHVGVDGISVQLRKGSSAVSIRYMLLAKSCPSAQTTLDSTFTSCRRSRGFGQNEVSRKPTGHDPPS